jgi:hypothetical protein
MKLLVSNETAVNVVFEGLNGFVLNANEQDIDFLALPDGFGLYDIYKDGYLRSLYDAGNVSIWFENEYKVESDCSIGEHMKDPLSYNYKTELLNGYWYTPVFTIVEEGEKVGTLSKTEYYRDYIDDNDKGELILTVEESYTIDDSDTDLYFTQRQAVERDKTWKLSKLDGSIETVKIKHKIKKYNTRRKSHKEGIKRRKNVEEQLIDNVALAGILSGVFTGATDTDKKNAAYDALVALEGDYENAFSAWINSGRGTLYDDIQGDTAHTWLGSTIPDNETTQATIQWMIGETFRSYIVEQLKGNIK